MPLQSRYLKVMPHDRVEHITYFRHIQEGPARLRSFLDKYTLLAGVHAGYADDHGHWFVVTCNTKHTFHANIMPAFAVSTRSAGMDWLRDIHRACFIISYFHERESCCGRDKADFNGTLSRTYGYSIDIVIGIISFFTTASGSSIFIHTFREFHKLPIIPAKMPLPSRYHMI